MRLSALHDVGFSPGPAPVPPPTHSPDDLFLELVVSRGHRARHPTGLAVSMLVHILVLSLVVLLPILWPAIPPEHPDAIRVLIYDPPPPPPPPPLLGSDLARTPARAVTHQPPVEPSRLTAPIESPAPAQEAPAEPGTETEQSGSPSGSPLGDPLGMEGGVLGGVVGGVPGGVLGGVVGGTGDIPLHEQPVLTPDRPPRLLRQVRPRYPDEAFLKKIEGTVQVEILIDSGGHVARMRIVQSIPALDAAAIEALKQWLFTPAIHHGQPVATLAMAPVTFRIY